MKKDEANQTSGQNQSEVQPNTGAKNEEEASASSIEQKIICLCMGVSEADIKRAVASGAKDFLDVQAATNAGLGCGTCPPQVKVLIKKYQAAKRQGGPARIK